MINQVIIEISILMINSFMQTIVQDIRVPIFTPVFHAHREEMIK